MPSPFVCAGRPETSAAHSLLYLPNIAQTT
jgi:hypothetical protein